MDKMKVSYEAMLSLTAEMIWDDAIRKYRTEKYMNKSTKHSQQGMNPRSEP